MSIPRIALLADLEHEISPDSVSDNAVFTFELAQALHDSVRNIKSIEVVLFARRNSRCDLPIVSLDPREIGTGTDPLNRFSQQESIYTQLIISRMLSGYHMIHCLAPIVTPLLLLQHQEIPVLRTITVNDIHPAAQFPHEILGAQFWRSYIGAYEINKEKIMIPPSVDINHFRPHPNPDDNFVLWLGTKGQANASIASRIADALNLPLCTAESGNPDVLIRHARLFLHLPDQPSPCESVWLLRALACGAPVAGWASEYLQKLFTRPELGVFTTGGQTDVLIESIKTLPTGNPARTLRHEYALGYFGRRALAARYRELYKRILERTEV